MPMPTRPLLLSAALLLSGAPAFAQEGNATAGETLFKRCVVCHTAEADQSKQGPSLKGIVGRHAATYPGYPYSAAMRAAGEQGLVWTEDNLSTFLKKPQAMVKGTWMAFPGLQKLQDILDIIAYLKQHAE